MNVVVATIAIIPHIGYTSEWGVPGLVAPLLQYYNYGYPPCPGLRVWSSPFSGLWLRPFSYVVNMVTPLFRCSGCGYASLMLQVWLYPIFGVLNMVTPFLFLISYSCCNQICHLSFKTSRNSSKTICFYNEDISSPIILITSLVGLANTQMVYFFFFKKYF